MMTFKEIADRFMDGLLTPEEFRNLFVIELIKEIDMEKAKALTLLAHTISNFGAIK